MILNAKRTFLTLLAGFFAAFAFAQTPAGCDGSRYVAQVSASTKKTTVIFATGVKNAANQPQDLKMDIFEPTGDVFASRPVMVLVHGGSFIAGSRTDVSIVNYAKFFAQRGYVTASIDYRLYPLTVLGFPDSLDIMDTAIKAVGDLKAAMRWFREDAAATNQFRVDPSQILVGGYSAGAVTALHAAYLDDSDAMPTFVADAVAANGGLAGTSGTVTNQAQSNAIAACVNLSGGLYKKEWINAGERPLVSFHGVLDNVVPYNFGLAASVMTLNGSGNLHPQAVAAPVESYLKTAPTGDHYNIHDANTTLPQRAEFLAEASQFLFEKVLCPGVSATVEPTAASFFSVAPNPAFGSAEIRLPEAEKGWTIEVFDPLGRMVEKVQNAPNSLIFNTLSTGVFTIRATHADGRRLTQRVVFQ